MCVRAYLFNVKLVVSGKGIIAVSSVVSVGYFAQFTGAKLVVIKGVRFEGIGVVNHLGIGLNRSWLWLGFIDWWSWGWVNVIRGLFVRRRVGWIVRRVVRGTIARRFFVRGRIGRLVGIARRGAAATAARTGTTAATTTTAFATAFGTAGNIFA